MLGFLYRHPTQCKLYDLVNFEENTLQYHWEQHTNLHSYRSKSDAEKLHPVFEALFQNILMNKIIFYYQL